MEKIEEKVELGKIIKTSISGEISGSIETDKMTTEEESYTYFSEWAKKDEHNVTITFDERCPAGYYAYLVFATVKVRAVLVKERATDVVKFGTYNELISREYSFAYNELDGTVPMDKSGEFKVELPPVDSLPIPTKAVGVVEIKNVQEFNKINENLSGKYVVLNDLDFKGARITPIGSSSKRFSGVIMGNGHTIKNFSVSADSSFAGLIARNAGRIENITVSGASISANCAAADAFAGVVAGENTGTIMNCTVSDCSVNAKAIDSNNTEGNCRYAIVGGIVGKISDGDIENCVAEGVSLYGYAKKHDKAWSEGWSEAAFVYVGGIVGEQVGGNVLSNTAKKSLEIEGSAEYRSNAFAKAATRSRICLGGIIGRQSADMPKLKNTSGVSEASFKKTFKSYNELVGGVDATEDYHGNTEVGYAG